MADTITTGLTLLFSTLHGDATFLGYLTGVFQDIAPEATLPDYCVIGVQSPGQDTLTATGVRRLTRTLYTVKIVGPAADMANISTAYQRADALLQPNGSPLRNAGGTLALYREGPLYQPEPQLINGKPWVNVGGFYRIEM